jgi:hypothetical protein
MPTLLTKYVSRVNDMKISLMDIYNGVICDKH